MNFLLDTASHSIGDGPVSYERLLEIASEQMNEDLQTLIAETTWFPGARIQTKNVTVVCLASDPVVGPEYRPGHEALWLEMSYTGWLTMPRVLMHEMPDRWQGRMAELLEEWEDRIAWPEELKDINSTVVLRKGGRIVRTPTWLQEYKHPRQQVKDMVKK